MASTSKSTITLVDDEVTSNLQSHQSSFERLINYIPPQNYLTNDGSGIGNGGLPGGGQKLSKKQKAKLRQEAPDNDLPRKNKRAKYDPDQPSGILDVQVPPQAPPHNHQSLPPPSSLDLDSPTTIELIPAGLVKDGKEVTWPLVSGTDNSHHRLRNRLDEIKGSEKAVSPTLSTSHSSAVSFAFTPPPNGVGSSASSSISLGDNNGHGREYDSDNEGPNSREELLEETRSKRAALREKRRRETKARKKREKSETKKSGKKTTKQGNDEKKDEILDGWKSMAASRSGAGFDGDEVMPRSFDVKGKGKAILDDEPGVGPSGDNPPDFSFSNLQFSNPTPTMSDPNSKSSRKGNKSSGGPGGHRPSKTPTISSSDPSLALSQIQKRQDFLSKLNPEQRERAEEKDKWLKAEKMLSGEKVRDDEKLLRKQIKRQEKDKAKKSQAWEERNKNLTETMAAKQNRRSENISARVNARKDKKMGVKKPAASSSSTKKKSRPGFEGATGGKRKRQ